MQYWATKVVKLNILKCSFINFIKQVYRACLVDILWINWWIRRSNIWKYFHSGVSIICSIWDLFKPFEPIDSLISCPDKQIIRWISENDCHKTNRPTWVWHLVQTIIRSGVKVSEIWKIPIDHLRKRRWCKLEKIKRGVTFLNVDFIYILV